MYFISCGGKQECEKLGTGSIALFNATPMTVQLYYEHTYMYNIPAFARETLEVDPGVRILGWKMEDAIFEDTLYQTFEVNVIQCIIRDIVFEE